MNDPGFGRFGADGVARLQTAQFIPEANATTKEDRSNRDVQPIDQARLEKVAHDTGAAANPDIFSTG